jgi:hypothetical protein
MSAIATIAAMMLHLSQPEAATRFAAQVFAPGLESELVAICKRESKCKRAISIHRGDAMHHGRVWRRAVARGWLQPWCQDSREGWSTRGSHGLMAGYHMRYLGVPCLPAAALDVPLLSAIAAARKAARLCTAKGACDAESLRDYWHGRGFARQRAGGTAQGGPPVPLLHENEHPPPARGTHPSRRMGSPGANLVELDSFGTAHTAQALDARSAHGGAGG